MAREFSTPGVQERIFDKQGRLREGVVIVKFVGKAGPYGYRVTYHDKKHHWTYLGKAEAGIHPGSYTPDTPLRFLKGRKEDCKWEVLVGNWDKLSIDADLYERMDRIEYWDKIAEVSN
jgi:hypothetical protein